MRVSNERLLIASSAIASCAIVASAVTLAGGQPQPAAGLMGTAAAQEVTVVDGVLTPVLLAYDTGIR